MVQVLGRFVPQPTVCGQLKQYGAVRSSVFKCAAMCWGVLQCVLQCVLQYVLQCVLQCVLKIGTSANCM